MTMPELAILFLNAGRRVELIRAFRQSATRVGIDLCVITTDIQGLAPALYEGDRRYLLPRSRDANFLEQLCALCLKEHVALIIPLIDPDLPVMARYKSDIAKTGTRVLVSNEDIIAICRDKESTGRFLAKMAYRQRITFLLMRQCNPHFHYSLNQRMGVSSINTFLVNNSAELEFFAHYIPNPLIQEYLEGEEYTIDVYSDWNGVPLLAIPRKRLKVRGGEISVGCIERNAELELLCLNVARILGTMGPINIQTIRTARGFIVTEINPRFGGGCPLSIAAGAPMPEWTICLAQGLSIDSSGIIIENEMMMMRFDESHFLSKSQVLR